MYVIATSVRRTARISVEDVSAYPVVTLVFGGERANDEEGARHPVREDDDVDEEFDHSSPEDGTFEQIFLSTELH